MIELKFFLILFELLVVILLTIFIFYYLLGFISAAPFVPSSNKVTKKIIEKIRGLSLPENFKVYELGSGSGKILIEIAKNFKCIAIGFELIWPLVFWSNLRVKRNNLKNIKFLTQNLFKSDIKDADLIVIYLGINFKKQLEQKLSESKPGTFIISNTFTLYSDNFELIETYIESGIKVHIYRVK